MDQIVHSITAAFGLGAEELTVWQMGLRAIVVYSRTDLMEALRTGPRLDGVEQVEIARLERSGDISAFKAEREPRVVEVSVADGVQTIRIEIA